VFSKWKGESVGLKLSTLNSSKFGRDGKMNAIINVENQAQPMLAKRVGYVLVQLGDELEAQVLAYGRDFSHAMKLMVERVLAKVDTQIIEQLAQQEHKNIKAVKIDIALAIQMLAWMYFGNQMDEPNWYVDVDKPVDTDLSQIPYADFGGMDGLEYQEMVRKEWW
jgi:hypothetical protein